MSPKKIEKTGNVKDEITSNFVKKDKITSDFSKPFKKPIQNNVHGPGAPDPGGTPTDTEIKKK